MKHLIYETIVTFDVDNTLVKWDRAHNSPGYPKLHFIDPYTGDSLYLSPHEVHIRLLKQYKKRGFGVVVWTKAGSLWAEEVINVLQLNSFVDMIMSKPDRWVDDKEDFHDVIGHRVFLHDRKGD